MSVENIAIPFPFHIYKDFKVIQKVYILVDKKTLMKERCIMDIVSFPRTLVLNI